MGIVSSAELMVSGVYLALGVIYLRFWWAERARTAYLAFAIACLSYMLFAWFELGMMNAATPEEYHANSWWAFIVGSIGLIAFAWFAYLHLHARKWLFVTYSAMRILALIFHLFMANGILFRQVTSVGRRTVLGEALSFPIAVQNPWLVLPHLSHVLLVILFLDASARSWRLGERRTALIFGAGTILFGMATLVVPTSVLWGLASIPILASFTVLLIVPAMLYELNYDMHRAAMAETDAAHLASRLAEIVANVPGIVWETRTEPGTGRRKTTFISHYVQTMLGYSPEEWLKQPPGFGALIIPEEERERVRGESDKVIQTGKQSVSHFRWIAKDGQIRWIENHLAPIVDEQAGIVGLRGVALDVTDRRAAQQAVRERETRLAETLDQLELSAAAGNVGLWTRKIGEEKMWFSAKAGEIWGFSSPDQYTRESFLQRIHPADIELFSSSLREVEAGKNEFQLEYRVMSKDGNFRWIHSRGKVDTVNGERFIRGAIVDITKLKMAEEAIHELSHKLMNAQEKERARLARELHDDLSQSIAVLSINLTMLRNDPKDLEYVKDQLDQHISTVQSLSGDIHRISHELHPAKLIHLGLEMALRGFCREFSAAHPLKIDFEVEDLPRDLPENISLCLYRVAQESLQNVIKHSAATAAQVNIRSEVGTIYLSVSDNGTGFDPEAAMAKESLGLISIDERVRAVNGTVTITSRAGAGTRIEVHVPVGNNSGNVMNSEHLLQSSGLEH